MCKRYDCSSKNGNYLIRLYHVSSKQYRQIWLCLSVKKTIHASVRMIGNKRQIDKQIADAKQERHLGSALLSPGLDKTPNNGNGFLASSLNWRSAMW